MRMASRSFPAAIALIAVVSVVHADWPVDPGLSGLLAYEKPYFEYDAVSLGPDGVLFATGYYPFTSSIHAMVVQRLSAQGTLPWGASGVVIGYPGNPLGTQGPLLAPDGAGGGFAIWYGLDQSTLATYMMAQRVDPNGALLWSPPLADVGLQLGTGAGTPWWVSQDGTGGFLAVWWVSSSPHIWRAQRVDANGSRLWAASGITVSTTSSLGSRFASDGAGGLIVFWSAPGTGGGLDLFAQRFGADGSPQWNPSGVAICSAPGDQAANLSELAAISDGAGGACVAWIDKRTDPLGDVYAQRVDASGAPLWLTDGVPLCTVPGAQTSVAAAPDGSAGLNAAWKDSRATNPPTGVDLYAQRVGSDGVVRWAAGGAVISNAPGDPNTDGSTWQASSWVAPDGLGGLFAVWRAQNDIHAQHLDASGNTIWPALGLHFGISGTAPALIPDGTGGCTVSWRGTGLRARPSSGPVTGVDPAISTSFALRGARPNPAHGRFGVAFSLAEAGSVRLDVLDVAGRRVWHRAEAGLGPGQHVFQVGRVKPGLYFLRLRQGSREATARVVVID